MCRYKCIDYVLSHGKDARSNVCTFDSMMWGDSEMEVCTSLKSRLGNGNVNFSDWHTCRIYWGQ